MSPSFYIFLFERYIDHVITVVELVTNENAPFPGFLKSNSEIMLSGLGLAWDVGSN